MRTRFPDGTAKRFTTARVPRSALPLPTVPVLTRIRNWHVSNPVTVQLPARTTHFPRLTLGRLLATTVNAQPLPRRGAAQPVSPHAFRTSANRARSRRCPPPPTFAPLRH